MNAELLQIVVNLSGGASFSGKNRIVGSLDAVLAIGAGDMIDISRIQQLLVQAPQPPKEVLPGGIADAECDAFEQRTGICLPDEIRQWLNVANGPCIGPGGLYGIQTQHLHLDMETILGMFPFWRTRKWIPIAGDDAGTAPGI